jgi:hypothetical protein
MGLSLGSKDQLGGVYSSSPYSRVGDFGKVGVEPPIQAVIPKDTDRVEPGFHHPICEGEARSRSMGKVVGVNLSVPDRRDTIESDFKGWCSATD